MIQIVQGFQLFTRDPVDWRLVLTKEQMCNVNDNQMPEIYFSICKDDGILYKYDKKLSKTENTGRFRSYNPNKIESVTINGNIIDIDSNGNLEIPIGYGLNSTDGIISIDFNAMDDNSIPFSKINFGDELILDGNE